MDFFFATGNCCFICNIPKKKCSLCEVGGRSSTRIVLKVVGASREGAMWFASSKKKNSWVLIFVVFFVWRFFFLGPLVYNLKFFEEGFGGIYNLGTFPLGGKNRYQIGGSTNPQTIHSGKKNSLDWYEVYHLTYPIPEPGHPHIWLKIESKKWKRHCYTWAGRAAQGGGSHFIWKKKKLKCKWEFKNK